MHHGIFIGENAKSRGNRIMILGESHHTDGNNQTELIEAEYKTSKVIEDYYKKRNETSVLQMRLRSRKIFSFFEIKAELINMIIQKASFISS